MSAPEFSRPFDRRSLPGGPVTLAASAAECAALARRFALPAIHRLEATFELVADGAVIHERGHIAADIVQSCAVAGDDLPVALAEDVTLRFVPPRSFAPDAEIELTENELDEAEYEGTAFDLGEAVAQSLVLAIDPFLEGPNAAKVRAEVLAAQEPSGPFAALAKLKKD